MGLFLIQCGFGMINPTNKMERSLWDNVSRFDQVGIHNQFIFILKSTSLSVSFLQMAVVLLITLDVFV